MLSKSCNFSEFLEKVIGCDYADLILLANKEATAAERTFYKQKAHLESDPNEYQEYAVVLKDFIGFLRNGIKSSSVRDFDFEPFHDVRSQWHQLQCDEEP